MRKFYKIMFLIAAVVIAAGYLIPEKKAMPWCMPSDYNHQSFWTSLDLGNRLQPWVYPVMPHLLLLMSIMVSSHQYLTCGKYLEVQGHVIRPSASIGALCFG